MKLLVALRDSKTGSFLAPMVAATPGEAERKYQEILETPGTLVQKFPRDFPLYHIGSYDEVNGEVFPLLNDAGETVLPRLLLEAAQYVQPGEAEPRISVVAPQAGKRGKKKEA